MTPDAYAAAVAARMARLRQTHRHGRANRRPPQRPRRLLRRGVGRLLTFVGRRVYGAGARLADTNQNDPCDPTMRGAG